MMSLRKELLMGCLSLLLLVMMMILVFDNSPTSADGSAKFGSFSKGSASEYYNISPVESSTAGSIVGGNKDGESSDFSLVDEKRRIHTGPNPLHNR
ncbi:hypothetical protein PanWU01x14_039600 [Parasponia andersonii]|uniref:CLAVATA3/ESR (CLE)-related protein n=1 Tax=Parasponia andersonii TaxID=3476 RepID=A0A2P5DQZ0_PARAD|nr:hypothetical protein PanWU01x14_039600 [Parasponia andersonii]